MARKSTNTDKKLLIAGRKLLIKKGASKLSIREVCSLAKVNLGMFSYHFDDKNQFIEIILNEIYNEFIVNLESAENKNDLEALEEQLLVICFFARDNRHLILVLLNDILNAEKAVQRFSRLKMKKHFIILAKTIRKCQKNGSIVNEPLPLILTHIAGSIGLSNLIPEVIQHLGINKIFKIGIKTVTKTLMTDKALKTRVDIVIKGLKNN